MSTQRTYRQSSKLVLLVVVSTLVQCATHGAGEREPANHAATSATTSTTDAEAEEQQMKSDKPGKETPERAQIPDRYKWKTTDLFASDAAWEKQRKAFARTITEVAACKGELRRGKKVVLSCLQRVFEGKKSLERLVNYAHRKYDEDTRVPRYQGYKQIIDKLATDFLEATSFLQPELLALPTKRLEGMIKDPAFEEFDQYLRDLLRLKPHILSKEEERLLASMSLLRESGYNVYSTFAAADLSFPTIKDSKGNEVQLTQSLFTKYRASESRRVRKDTFNAFFGTYKSYRNTLASLLGTQINANIVYAKSRRYGSALEAALDADNIPTAVYHKMIKAVNKHLPLLHRYLKLRQKLLGVKELRYYDMYPPIVKKVKLEYEYDEGRELMVEALEPMGKEYLEALKQGLDPDQGWVDVYPNKGKRSGAYMDGSAYDVHPYVLANFLDDYSSVSTMAHEMGHAMHSFFSSKSQPYPKADYSIFVAEVASTLNEALLMHHMLDQVDDPKTRLYLLGEKLEDFRQTVFRQAMFAEFELALYQQAERKEAITAEVITDIYLDIVRRYYGHDQNVVTVDDLYGMEWAYVPHFYYNYYVFQYTTGMTAAVALAEMIRKDGVSARDRYIKHLLRAGGSDYPVELLKRAGVNLTTTRPYAIAMADFERTLEEAEKVVKQLER